MSHRDELVAQLQAKLDEWNAGIDELEAKARKKEAESTAEYHAQLAKLKGKRDEAAEKLYEIRNASEDAWESLKSGAERVWDDVTRTFQETREVLSNS